MTMTRSNDSLPVLRRRLASKKKKKKRTDDDQQDTNDDSLIVATTGKVQGNHFNPLDNSKIALFYNIYVADDMEGVIRAGKIIETQIDQISCSAAVASGPVTLYYNTINRPLHDGFMESVCREKGLVCRHLEHYDSGYEELTLQRLYDFCKLHDDYRAIYFHSKGSYHDWEWPDFSQSAWRDRMMKAIMSDYCLAPPDPSCDICGLVALPWPNLHFAGNFFTANCAYVQKLIPPSDFRHRMNNMVEKALYEKLEDRFVANMLPDAPHHFGIGRFASEHWLGSHPSVAACDVSQVPDVKYWQNPGPISDEPGSKGRFEFAMYPRHAVWSEWSYMYKTPSMFATFSNLSLRLREWYLLAGNLFRWMELYGEIPPSSSWVWSWFPDGDMWHDQFQQHGANVVQVVTSQYIQEEEE